MMSLLGALKGTSVLAVKIETTGVIAWKPYNTKTQRAWVNGLNFSPFFLVIDVSCERLGERVSSDLLLQAMAGQRRTSLVDCVNNEDSLQRTNSMTKSTCMYIYIYIYLYTSCTRDRSKSLGVVPRNIHAMLKHSEKQIGHNIDIRQHVKTIINSTRPR